MLFIEISVLVYADFGFKGAIDESILFFVQERVIVNLAPVYSLLWIDCQTFVYEIFGVIRDVYFAEIWTIVLYLF